MNKNIVLAVAKRDLRSWFGNPTNYVFIILFVVVSAAAQVFPAQFFVNNLANLDTWTDWFPLVALFFVAAATMGMWTSERANGTQELLFTLPAHDIDLLLGKFFAYVAVWTAALLFTLTLPIGLSLLGSPDWGQIFANYVGFWLFGVMLVAVSMVGSQLTGNATIAFILSAIVSAGVVYLGSVLKFAGFPSWGTNGTLGMFGDFARGLISPAGIVLFLGLTATFLYLNLALLSRRHWRSAADGSHGFARSFAFGIATLSLTIIGVHSVRRIDATSEGIHSLSTETTKLLAGLDPKKPIVIKAYVSDEVPESLVQQRRLMLNLIDQFVSFGGGTIQKEVLIPEPYSPVAIEAESNYGIRAQTVPVELTAGAYSEMQVFLGFAVICGTEEAVTQFVEPGLPLEYELTRAVRVVSNAKRKKVGILKTDVDLAGGYDFQTFQQKTRWQIADELEEQYQIEQVDADKDYPAGIDCLLVPQPSSLPQEQMSRLQKWMLAGNPTLLLEDPLPLQAPGTAADDEKGGMQARMMGQGGPQKGDLDGLLGSIGLHMPKAELVWDTSSRGRFGGQFPLTFLFANKEGMSNSSIITKGLQSAVFMMSGHFLSTGKEGVNVQSLVCSAAPHDGESMNGVVPKYESAQGRGDGFLVFDFFGRMQPNPNVRLRPRGEQYDLVVRVSGLPKGSDKQLNVIAWADLDAVGNQFFQIRRQSSDETMRFDNVPLVMNCIDSLVGDESLIELRKRRPILRRLTAVEKAQSAFEKTWAEQKKAAEDESDKALDEAKARLDSAVDKIRKDTTLDEQSKATKVDEAEKVENRRFETEKANIEAKKKMQVDRALHDRDEARKSTYTDYRIWFLLLTPVPALLVGLLILARRRSRARAIVPQNRQVVGGAR